MYVCMYVYMCAIQYDDHYVTQTIRRPGKFGVCWSVFFGFKSPVGEVGKALWEG